MCLVNEANWDAPPGTIRQAFDGFAGLLRNDPGTPFRRSHIALATWQGLERHLRIGPNAVDLRAAALLAGHPCLRA